MRRTSPLTKVATAKTLVNNHLVVIIMTPTTFLRRVQEYRKLQVLHASLTAKGETMRAAAVMRELNALAKTIDDELPGQIGLSEMTKLF